MGSYRLVSGRRREVVAAGLFVLLVVGVLTLRLGPNAEATAAERCARFHAQSVARHEAVSGTGERVVVIGDSWSAGLGLSDATHSWPSRLTGQVHVAGFSGSGFSRHASDCASVSFATRAPAAVRGGADLVVVEGGLNDYDQPDADIRAGFERLMDTLDGRRVVVVGPAPAPSRAAAVPHVDALLAELSQQYGVPYVSALGWRLPYLEDRLHLTEAGHQLFGDEVAAALAALS